MPHVGQRISLPLGGCGDSRLSGCQQFRQRCVRLEPGISGYAELEQQLPAEGADLAGVACGVCRHERAREIGEVLVCGSRIRCSDHVCLLEASRRLDAARPFVLHLTYVLRMLGAIGAFMAINLA
jgi:hypothetical protein